MPKNIQFSNLDFSVKTLRDPNKRLNAINVVKDDPKSKMIILHFNVFVETSTITIGRRFSDDKKIVTYIVKSNVWLRGIKNPVAFDFEVRRLFDPRVKVRVGSYKETSRVTLHFDVTDQKMLAISRERKPFFFDKLEKGSDEKHESLSMLLKALAE